MTRALGCILMIFFGWSWTWTQNDWQTIGIPMRDGKNLIADLYLPNQFDSFPVVLIQTPYNKNFFRNVGLPLGIGQDLTNSAYAFVVLDWRCRFASIGACNPDASNGEDGYDAVEWIAMQSWSNGKIGTLGPSALGNVQYQTAKEQPPHLICAIPEVASPQFHYQQYLPGGVLRSAYLNTLNLLFPGSGFNLLVANPHYNIIWRIAEAETMFPDDINVPMLLVGGWFDHNTVDNLRMIDTLAKASDVSVRDKHKILMGPWVHGGTGQAIVGSTQQGELTFPEADGWNNLFSLQFMDHYLRGIDDGWEEHERYIFFQMGDQNWQQSPTWPPSGVTMQNLYAGVDGSLNKESSTTNQNYSFVYDPLDPSPTVGGKTLSLNLSQGPYDQAEVEARGDNIILSSADLTSSLIVKGRIGVKLYIASDRFDTDIALRLTDVYPDGRSILLGESILRMRFRQGFSVMDTMFIQPGEIYPIDMQFDDLAHTFLAGHQVRVIITSSNYPHFNRNMNTGGDMYPGNNVDTLVGPLIARNSIWFGPDYPSRVELPVELTSTATNDVGENSGSLNISPNPATDQIEIRNLSGTNQIVICDHLGRNRFRQIVSGSTMIELPNLENGLYFIHSKDQHRRLSSGKFLVLR